MANAKQMPSGNWRVQVYLGTNQNGRKLKKSITAPTRWEAEKLAAEFLENIHTEQSRFTVAQAIRGYIDSKKNVLSLSTVHFYEGVLKHRLPLLMQMDIHEVDSIAMQRAINEEAATKSRKTIAEGKNLVVAALKMYGIAECIRSGQSGIRRNPFQGARWLVHCGCAAASWTIANHGESRFSDSR